MSDRPVDLLIEDILERIRRIGRYTRGLDHDAFVQDEKTVDAVVRSLGVIGKAARRVPQAFADRHPGIPWRQIVGLRNRIVHDYFNVDLDLVWQIVRDELPSLESELARLKRRAEPRGGSDLMTAALRPWHAVATPHADIREGRLDEAVFAANVWAVVQGTAPEVYLDPEEIFRKTYM